MGPFVRFVNFVEVVNDAGVFADRPYLTTVVDVFSRAILGFWLTIEKASSFSVALCLARALCPKDAWLSARGLGDHDWPVFGRPGTLVVDGAKEFKGAAFGRGCKEYGIAIRPRHRGNVHQGGVEGGAARCGARDPYPRRGQTLSSDDAGAHASHRGRSPRQTPIVCRRVVSSMTGDHLFDNVRPWLARPVDDRIAFIRSARWIGAPQARAAHAMLEELLVRPPSLRANGLMLLGPNANGKSMIAERFALTRLKATRAKGEAQKVWVVQTREGAGAILAAFQAPQTKARDTLAKAEQLDHTLRRLRPRILIFDEFHNCLCGRRRNVEAIFAVLRRLGREYDISPALVGEATVYDRINLTDEMASRFALAPVPRWSYGEDYLALLDSLEAALPLARTSRLSDETIARTIFALSHGLIGEIVGIVTRAATQAVRDGAEHITTAAIEALAHVPLSRRRGSPQRDALL